MFEKSRFERLQEYVESGCADRLDKEDQDYYNALYAVVGVYRKYGTEKAVAMLMAEPFGCTRRQARRMYFEAVNLFYLDDGIEPEARRSLIFDNLMKAAQVVLMTARTAKDFEIYGNLQMQAYKVKRLDLPDPPKRKEPDEKPIKIYTTDTRQIGIPAADRTVIAAQIDALEGISERDRNRLRMDAGVQEINFEEMLNDTQEKTEPYRK